MANFKYAVGLEVKIQTSGNLMAPFYKAIVVERGTSRDGMANFYKLQGFTSGRLLFDGIPVLESTLEANEFTGVLDYVQETVV